jgi:hypothetical protein
LGGDFLLKIFTTQLSGVFTSILEKQNDEIEDGARLLSQAIVSGGSLYIYGTNEMQAIIGEAIDGAEPIQNGIALYGSSDIDSISLIDRVLLMSRYTNDDQVLLLAQKLHEKGIPFVSVAASVDNEGKVTLADLADIHIEIPLKKGLVPVDDGSRIGLPFSMVGLYVYYGLKFSIDEMVREFEEELE